MTRTREWSLRGTSLIAKVTRSHWKTPKFLARLRHDRIVAPCVIETLLRKADERSIEAT